MPRLARLVSARESGEFLRSAVRLAGMGFGLGLAGAGVAVAIGPVVLRIMYGRQFDAYAGLLVGVMGAAALGYAGIALGFAITAARAFDAQAPLFCLVAATCGGASWLLTPKFGLWGAVMALALAALTQISGEALLLRRALRGMAASR
jgi:O-antigen/teichoic acid export membrane protein